MSNGHLVDSIRYIVRSPTEEVVDSWADDINIIETDSGKIRVKDTGGVKPTLVMVPDGPSVIEHFDSLISELVSDFRVVCFDMPGFGFSYPSLSYDFGLEESSNVIISVMDALNIKQATLSFSCINGHIAIAVAKTFPERVSRLVLAQTPSLNTMKNKWVTRNVPKIVKVPYIGQIINGVMEKTFSSKWYGVALPRNSPHKVSFAEKSSVALHSGGCFCFASIVQGMVKEKNYTLEKVEIPTMMVWGSSDWSHKNTNFDSLRENVPNCEIVEFKNCGHFPNLEEPKKYAEILKSFKK